MTRAFMAPVGTGTLEFTGDFTADRGSRTDEVNYGSGLRAQAQSNATKF